MSTEGPAIVDARSADARRGASLAFDVDLVPRTVLRRLLAAVGILLLASVAGQVLLREAPGVPLSGGIAYALYVDSEQSLPTIFSVLLLGITAALLAVIAAHCRRAGARDGLHWAAAAGLAGVLALDEYLSLHEQLIDPLRRLLGSGPGGLLHYTWVVPGLLGALAVALLFVPFLARQPVEFRRRVLLSGALYLTGALGVEMLGGAIENAAGDRTGYRYLAATTLEEGLEMTAVVLLLRALLAHLSQTFAALDVRADLREATPAPAYPCEPAAPSDTAAASPREDLRRRDEDGPVPDGANRSAG